MSTTRRVGSNWRTVRVKQGATVYRHGRRWAAGETLKMHPGDIAHCVRRGTVEEVG